jgi:ABC-type branched-subunit amino acid transport system substrate-binding protein
LFVKTKRFATGILVLVALLMTLPLGAMSCKRNTAPAGTEIKIGIMAGLTGLETTAATIADLMDELELIFEYTNEVEGGISGATIDWEIVDNESNPSGAVAAYQTLRDSANPPLLYFAVEDYYLVGAKETINEDESVVLTVSAIVPDIYTLPSRFFAVTIPTSDGFGGFVNWVKSDFEGTGNPKIGVLYWDDRSSGAQWMMAKEWALSQGVEIVESGYSVAAQDLTAPLSLLRDADVDYIWMHGVTPNAALAVNTYSGIGFDEDVKFCFMEYVESDKLLELVGDAAEGFYIYRSETPYSDNSVAAQYYTDIYEHAGVENEQSDFRHLITLKYVIQAAIERAAANVGWDNLDNTAVYEALLELTDIDTHGNTGDFGFGPEKRLGVNAITMARFTADGTESVSGEMELPDTFMASTQTQ